MKIGIFSFDSHKHTIKNDKTATGDIMYAFSILALEQHSKKGNFAMVKHQPRMIKEPQMPSKGNQILTLSKHG